MTTIVEPRPCKTCGEPANYIGTSATGTAFACPACADTSWYYDDEPEICRCQHARDLHYRDGSEQGGGCDGMAIADAPARCRCKGYGPGYVDVSLALAEHTARALNTLAPEPYRGYLGEYGDTPDPVQAGPR